MSLRKTILLSVAVIFFGLTMVLLLNLQTILSSHFSDEEQQSMSLDVQRAQGALSGEAESLQLAVREWLLREKLPAYLQADALGTASEVLREADLRAAQVGAVALVSARGQMGLVTSTPLAWPAELAAWLQAQRAAQLAPGLGERQGWLRTSNGPLLVALQPVGVEGSWLVAARLLAADRLAILGQRASLGLDLFAVDGPDLPADVRLALPALQVNIGERQVNIAGGDTPPKVGSNQG